MEEIKTTTNTTTEPGVTPSAAQNPASEKNVSVNNGSENEYIMVAWNHCERGKTPNKFDFRLPFNALFKDLVAHVSMELGYSPTIFEIHPFGGKNSFPNSTDEDNNSPISTYFSFGKKNLIDILRNPTIDPGDPRFLRGQDALNNRGESLRLSNSSHDGPSINYNRSQTNNNYSINNITLPSMSHNVHQQIKYSSDQVYCGLSNQGATCYLNSLLQTLFMTPEFRSALYNWSFDDFAQREFNKKLSTLHSHLLPIPIPAPTIPAPTPTPAPNPATATATTTETPTNETPTTETPTAPNSNGSSIPNSTEEPGPESENSDLNLQLNNKPMEEVFANYKAKLEENCIPRQLQKLFMKLNTSEKRAIKTKNLTKSFGWKQADAFTQHDVQELCRVLFDTVDKVWEGTEQANFINELYQGEMKDYVQCLNCNYESSRTDKYLDIPLVIRGFGQSNSVSSIQEALYKFIEPEMLVEDNQYLCEKCSKKCDARKGLKFTKLPYLLCLQLKRFDFDFDQLRRIKLNDRVTFPEVLDMNLFLYNDDPNLAQNINNTDPNIVSNANPNIISNADPNIVSNANPNIISNANPDIISNANPNTGPSVAPKTEPNGNSNSKVNNGGDSIPNSILTPGKQARSEVSVKEEGRIERKSKKNKGPKSDDDDEDLILNSRFRDKKMINNNGNDWNLEDEDENKIEFGDDYHQKVFEHEKIHNNGNGKEPNFDDEKVHTERINHNNHAKEPTIEEALKNGPYVYTLYSVLIHRGSALGGHYFAYIKSFSKDKWFEFNDSMVQGISSNYYTTTFGDNSEKKLYNHGTNAYMLMYRLYDPSRNMVEYSKDNLPDSVKRVIEEENRKELEKEQEKERQKELCNIKLSYKDISPVEIRVNRSDSMEKIRDLAVKQFNIEKYFPNNIRLRIINNWNSVPGEPIVEEKLQKPVCDFTSTQYYIETKEDNEEFHKYSQSDFTIKCSFYNQETGVFSPFSFVTFPKDVLLCTLKEKISKIYNLPVENIMVVEELHYPKILDKENLSVFFQVYNSSSPKLYFEPKTDGVPKSFQHIEKIRNSIQISFTNPDEKEFKHSLIVDKRISLLELKKIMEPIINLSTEEFLVYRYIGEISKYELKNEDEKIDKNLYAINKLLIERGRPLHKGELLCKFSLYDIIKDTKSELFQLILVDSITLLEVKEEVIKHFNQLITSNGQHPKLKDIKDFPKDPERLRIRRYMVRPSTIFPSSKTLKEYHEKNYFSSNSIEVIIQILPENQKEEKVSDEDIIIILRQFFPDKFELSAPQEIRLKKYDKLGEIRLRISEAIGIPTDQLSVAVTDFDNAQKILNIPNLVWYPPPPDSDIPKAHRQFYNFFDPNRSLSSITQIEDGSMLICRNLTVPIKNLSKEDMKKINNEEEQMRNMKYRSYYRKEDSLSINIKDVPIFDNLKTSK